MLYNITISSFYPRPLNSQPSRAYYNVNMKMSQASLKKLYEPSSSQSLYQFFADTSSAIINTNLTLNDFPPIFHPIGFINKHDTLFFRSQFSRLCENDTDLHTLKIQFMKSLLSTKKISFLSPVTDRSILNLIHNINLLSRNLTLMIQRFLLSVNTRLVEPELFLTAMKSTWLSTKMFKDFYEMTNEQIYDHIKRISVYEYQISEQHMFIFLQTPVFDEQNEFQLRKITPIPIKRGNYDLLINEPLYFLQNYIDNVIFDIPYYILQKCIEDTIPRHCRITLDDIFTSPS